MLQILDPHLRPVPPAPMDQTSQKIYDDHMKLAQEYFKVICVCISQGFHSSKYSSPDPNIPIASSESNRDCISHEAQGEHIAKYDARGKKTKTRLLQ